MSIWSIASHCTEVLCHHIESQCPLAPPSMTSHYYPSHEAKVLPFLHMSTAGLTSDKCRIRADQAMTPSCICRLRTQSISRGSLASSPRSAETFCCSIQCIDIAQSCVCYLFQTLTSPYCIISLASPLSWKNCLTSDRWDAAVPKEVSNSN